MVSKRAFTLLEIVVAMALIAMVAALLGWRGHEAVVQRRFETELALFRNSCEVCQRLAVTMQADWKGTLKRQGSQWVFETVCVDSSQTRSLKAVQLHPMEISFNRGKVAKEWTIQFFASGKVSPQGTLLFEQKEQKKELKLPDLFGSSERGALKLNGPLHPADLKAGRAG